MDRYFAGAKPMSMRKATEGNEPTIVVSNDPDSMKGALKSIGGSQSDMRAIRGSIEVVDAQG